MAIGDISKRHFFPEKVRDGVNSSRCIHYPDGMNNAIGRREIIFSGMVLFPVIKNIIELFDVFAGEEYISGLGTDGAHMRNAVKLFFRSCEFVFFNYILEIILYR